MDTPQQAHSALRSTANDAAWWLRHTANVIRSEGLSLALANTLEMKATDLDAKVKAANDALDREAFGA